MPGVWYTVGTYAKTSPAETAGGATKGGTRMKKRFLCLLLILVMTLSLLPTAVLAEDGSSENKTFATLEKG